MKFLIGIKPLKTSYKYFTMRNKVGASRIIAFNEYKTAQEFKNYLGDYRAKYNIWPQLDASSEPQTQGSINIDEYICPEQVENLIQDVDIVEIKDEDLLYLSSQNNLDSIITKSFEYDINEDRVKMTAYENVSTLKDINMIRINLEKLA